MQNRLKIYKFNNHSPPPQKNQTKEENPIQHLRKGKTNEFSEINNYVPNKTYSNMNNMKAMNLLQKNNIKKKEHNEVQKNNYDKSLENILIEEIEKDNKKKKEKNEIPDIVLKHKESKILLLNYNKNQKMRKYSNNIHEIKSGKNLGKKFSIINFNNPSKKESAIGDSVNISFFQKNSNENEKDNNDKNNNDKNNIDNNSINENSNNKSDNIINNNSNDNPAHNHSTINEIKNYNDNNNINNNNDYYIENNSENKSMRNIIQETKKNINKNNFFNKNLFGNNINIKDRIMQEAKPLHKLIDDLKIPQILDKRILSNDELEEIKLNTEKTRRLNKKINFRLDHNKSVSASYKSIKKKNPYFSPNHNQAIDGSKTLKDWRKNIMNKAEKNMRLTKERNNNNNVYNLVNLELGNENYTMNGATVLANKKLVNNHVTKMEMPNSFSRLFNAQISNTIIQNDENQ